MTTDELVQKYWNYYLMLEQKVLETRNYVEFRAGNYNTSSNEFGLLMISIGAELDNFLKTYCKIPEEDRHNPKVNMGTYCGYLSAHYPKIANETITVLNTDPSITLRPFELLAGPDHFPWWDAYNQVKHNRYENFTEAKLINAITLLSALFLLEMKEFKNIYDSSADKEHAMDCPLNQSKLFALKEWRFNSGPCSNMKYNIVHTVTPVLRYE